MYKNAIRVVPRRVLPSRSLIANSSRRFLSTAPPAKQRRSWKSSAARWGVAAAGIYFYNTSDVFAEEPEVAIQRLDESIHAVQESNQPTIDAIVEEKRKRQAYLAAEEQKKEQLAKAALAEDEPNQDSEGEKGMGGLEEEADSQGAFNPETGEINWDCPCLGGMAHGPCGEEFRAAFSCFVYSNEEPKGVECIDKFKGMQDCFRQHPDMYGSELDEDEDEVDALLAKETAQPPKETPVESSVSETASAPSTETTEKPSSKAVSAPATESKTEQPTSDLKKEKEYQRDSEHTTPGSVHIGGDEGGELLPKSAHDATR